MQCEKMRSGYCWEGEGRSLLTGVIVKRGSLVEVKKQLIEQASKVDISLVGNGLDSMALRFYCEIRFCILNGSPVGRR